MKAYGVFDGGGVKGAALAGGLAAAEDQDIEFIGFGGTSAGSIVAFLAAVGYSGKELGNTLIAQNFNDFLDDGGSVLGEVLELVRKIAKWRGSALDKLKALLALKEVLARMQDLGLYTGHKVKEFLLEKAATKIRSWEHHLDITFEDLERARCPPLRIVASNVLGGRSAILPRDREIYGSSVLEAIRASAGYPFAFRPLEGDGFRLVDGGLSSNLPSFLFAKEYRVNRIPTFAFDLVTPFEDFSPPYDLDRYLSDLLNTALEAGDELLRDVSDGVVHIPIEVPKGIKTLDFGITKSQREELYKAGYERAASFLAGYGPLQVAKFAGNRLKSQLVARYGEVKLYQPVLAALARDAKAFSRAKDVRTHVMLPTGRGTLIVVYQIGMDGDTDSDLELYEAAGCCGQAWTTASLAVADLERMATDLAHWRLNQEEYSKIPKSRRSMMSVPILGVPFGVSVPGHGSPRPPVGVLSIDSSTRLDDTEWVKGMVVDERIVEMITGWAEVVSRMLP
jgi:NTE family protein